MHMQEAHLTYLINQLNLNLMKFCVKAFFCSCFPLRISAKRSDVHLNWLMMSEQVSEWGPR